MYETKVKVCKDIAKILKLEDDIVLENTNTTFFDKPYDITAEDLLYIYFHIKRNYCINLDDTKIKEGAFQSIDGICEIIK